MKLAATPITVKRKSVFDNQKFSFEETSVSLDSGQSLVFTSTEGFLPKDLRVNLTSTRLSKKKLCIVYFFNAQVSRPGYPVFANQLKDLVESGLFNQQIYQPIEIWIVLTANRQQVVELTSLYNSVLSSLNNESLNTIYSKNIIQSNYNHYELPALRFVWELAQTPDNSESIFLYFHGKGTSHRDSNDSRNFREAFLTKLILNSWITTNILFELLPVIDKVGFMSSAGNWLWYNFWWTRASYLRQLDPPCVSDDRHYYESWLGTAKKRQIMTEPDARIASTAFGLVSNPSKQIFNIGTPVSAQVASLMCALGAHRASILR